MSTTKRIISGSAASWARIIITIVSQVILVPLYLQYWSVETFGIWIVIQALVSLLTTFDMGHQTFLEFEFLRLGKDNKDLLVKNLSSGILISILINSIQIVFIVILLTTGLLSYLLNIPDSNDAGLIHAAGIVLLLQGIGWLINNSVLGLFGRILSPFGYYPRIAWWNVGNAIVFAISSAIAVIYGAGLLVTGIVATVASVIFSIPFYFDLLHLMRKENIKWSAPSFRLGANNFYRSLILTVKTILDNIRQQGVRIILTPLSNLEKLAAFSTTRTGANFAMQGLNTITNPLLPELMRFLHQRDQVRSEAAFGIVWIVVVAIMSPCIVILQMFIKPLFSIWTHGKILVDPLLFALLSLSVLVYAWSQPAMAIVRGNNLLKPQLYLSLVTAVIVIGFIFILVPWFGILGAGVALLIAEIIAAIWHWHIANRWLFQNGLFWPKSPSSIAASSVCITGIVLFLLALLPESKWIILSAFSLFFFWNTWRFWQVLPSFAAKRVRRIITLPGIRGL